MVDALDSKSSPVRGEGSSPSRSTLRNISGHGHVFRVGLGTGLQNHERGFDPHRALNKN